MTGNQGDAPAINSANPCAPSPGETWLTICGYVVGGDQRGRTIGFPTANLRLPDAWVTVEDGVYAGFSRTQSGDVAASAISIGRRPTIYAGDGDRLLEVHLIGFDGDLYGEVLTVGIVTRLRAQVTFDSVEELQSQLRADVDRAASAMEAVPARWCGW